MLGQGGFGLVHQAYDHASHREVVAKVPLGRREFDKHSRKRQVRYVDSPQAKPNLIREVRVWMGLAHPHIVQAFDVRDDETAD